MCKLIQKEKILLLSTLISFLLPSFCLAEIKPVFDSDLKVLVESGNALVKKNDFSGALKFYNKAMGILKQTPQDDPIRIELEKKIRVTKGRLLVSRFRLGNVKISPIGQSQQVAPKEPKDFLITQVFGSVLARELWPNRDSLFSNESLGIGRRITVLPNGGIELVSIGAGNMGVRAAKAASFELRKENEVELHSGSCLLNFSGRDPSASVFSPLSDMTMKSNDPFVVMIGVTTNGGMKMICLLGKITVQTKNESLKLLPGELCFVLSEGFSRKMNVELSTLIATSSLLTDFDKPPPYSKRLSQQAMLQAMRTSKRFRTVVGDVKNRDNFEVRVLREESP